MNEATLSQLDGLLKGTEGLYLSRCTDTNTPGWYVVTIFTVGSDQEQDFTGPTLVEAIECAARNFKR